MKVFYDKDGKEYFNRICPYCKEKVPLYRIPKDAVMFDNDVYHKKCYVEMKQVQKKCKHCDNTFLFHGSKNDPVMVYYQNAFYCHDCFEKLCEDGKSKNSRKWKNAYANLDKYLANAVTQIDSLLSRKHNKYTDLQEMEESLFTYVSEAFDEYDVNEFLRENYKIQDINAFYTRYLKPLYHGTYKKYEDLIIPPSHLLEMWKTKIGTLNKMYQRNIKNGKSFTVTQHLAYDLAVLIGKYDSFLEWKNKQKVLEHDVTQIAPDQSYVTTSINIPPAHYKKSNANHDELEEIITDIFD